jgi:hypothetical protein
MCGGAPHAVVEHVRNSPKINIFCALSCDKVYRLFFFGKKTFIGIISHDMLELWLMPQLLLDKPNVVLQHDGAPPHIHDEVTFLNRQLPEQWISQGGVHFLASAISRSDNPQLFPVGLCER